MMTEWYAIPDPFWPFPGKWTVARDVHDEKQFTVHTFNTKEEAQEWADKLNSES